MIRTVSFIQRRADIDRGAFRHHYENRHAPLALPKLAGLEHYVRNHVLFDGGPTSVSFDAISEFEYRDRAAFDSMIRFLDGPDGESLRRDELNFMNKPGNSFFHSNRSRITDGLRPPPGSAPKAIAIVRTSRGVSRGALSKHTREVGCDIAAAGNAVHIELDVARDSDPQGEPAWEALLHVWYPGATRGEEALSDLARHLSDLPEHCCLWIREQGNPVTEPEAEPTR